MTGREDRGPGVPGTDVAAPHGEGSGAAASLGGDPSSGQASGPRAVQGASSQGWILDLSLSFVAQLRSLHARDARNVREQVAMLARDPTLDGHRKRRVARLPEVHQLSAGEHRVFYACDRPRVRVLAVHRRGDRGYYEFIMGDGRTAPDAWLPARRALLDRLAELRSVDKGGTLDVAERAELGALEAAFHVHAEEAAGE